MKSAFVRTALVIAPSSPFEPEASALLVQLWTELAEKYPDELEGRPFSREQLAVSGSIFLLARLSERAVGSRTTLYHSSLIPHPSPLITHHSSLIPQYFVIRNVMLRSGLVQRPCAPNNRQRIFPPPLRRSLTL